MSIRSVTGHMDLFGESHDGMSFTCRLQDGDVFIVLEISRNAWAAPIWLTLSRHGLLWAHPDRYSRPLVCSRKLDPE